MIRWEYSVVTESFNNDDAIEETLKSWGERGWELVSAVAYGGPGNEIGVNQVTLFLKRLKGDEEKSVAEAGS